MSEVRFSRSYCASGCVRLLQVALVTSSAGVMTSPLKRAAALLQYLRPALCGCTRWSRFGKGSCKLTYWIWSGHWGIELSQTVSDARLIFSDPASRRATTGSSYLALWVRWEQDDWKENQGDQTKLGRGGRGCNPLHLLAFVMEISFVIATIVEPTIGYHDVVSPQLLRSDPANDIRNSVH